MKYCLVCDESGAKGRATNHEAFSGEVGVISGFLIPEVERFATNARLEPYFQSHRGGDGKVHITDLSHAVQQILRENVYRELLALQVPCFYEAIHVEGFAVAHANEEAMQQAVKAERRSHIRVTGNDPKPVLHNELFLGMMTKVLAHIEDAGIELDHLTVLTDPVDGQIVSQFKNAVAGFTNPPRRQVVKGWDEVAKKRVEGAMCLDWSQSSNYELDILKSLSWNVEIDVANSALTCAADVIANTMNHHFKQRDAMEVGLPLNNTIAVALYPLLPVLKCLWNRPEQDWFSDMWYIHPINGWRNRMQNLLEGLSDLAHTSEARQLIKQQAYRLWEMGKGRVAADINWYRAREELNVPRHIHL